MPAHEVKGCRPLKSFLQRSNHEHWCHSRVINVIIIIIPDLQHASEVNVIIISEVGP